MASRSSTLSEDISRSLSSLTSEDRSRANLASKSPPLVEKGGVAEGRGEVEGGKEEGEGRGEAERAKRSSSSSSEQRRSRCSSSAGESGVGSDGGGSKEMDGGGER